MCLCGESFLLTTSSRHSHRIALNDSPRRVVASRMRSVVLGVLSAALSAAVAMADDAGCMAVSGRVNTYCYEAFSSALERCRAVGDEACEEAARGAGGLADQVLARTEAPLRAACDDASSEVIGYVDANDVVKRAGEFCRDFGEDFLALGFVDDIAALNAEQLACQRSAAAQLRWLRREIVRWFGPRCALRAYQGGACNRTRRDAKLSRLIAVTRSRIEAMCGETFATLGLGPLDTVLQEEATRARHFAIRVFPPNDHGPTGEFGPYPIGVTTLALTDPSRMAVDGAGPRPVLTEVY